MTTLTSVQQIRLTPTARLSRRLAQQQALAAQSAGASAWLPEQIHSFPAWLVALRQEYFLLSDDLRTPIDAQQALQLWRMPIDAEVFVGTSRVAELAQQAWRLIHEHQLQQPQHWPALLMSEDNKTFQGWAQSYQQICQQQDLIDEWSFAAELPKHIQAGVLNIPHTIALDGFELALTPLQENILQAFEAAGSKIERATEQPTSASLHLPQVQQFSLASQELTAAATWARESLEVDPSQSIAIVVPDLSGRLDAVERTLRAVFNPSNFTLQDGKPEPWHISLGKPLSEWPLVETAIRILQQNNSRFSQPQIAELVRSPFLPGWDQELPARAQMLVHLARKAPYYLTAGELLRALHPTDTDIEEEGLFARHLRAWREERRAFQQSATPSQWAANFQQELTSIGFGNGRALNSTEYQTLQRWHSLLEDFSRLDLVSRAPMSRDEAIGAIQERAAKTVFRERNVGVPIEVLGVAEALGSTFDAIWITTLDSNTWPGNLGRDPLVPGPVQAQVPRATGDGCLAAAQAELRGLLNCAPVIQASYAQGTEEVPVQVAGLLGPLEILEQAPLATPSPAPMEIIAADTAAPELHPDSQRTKVKGGTGVLQDQSDCPFRAFAHRRLGAVDTTPPRPGLDAMQRGVLVHKALEIFWHNISGLAELIALSEQTRQQQVSEAVQQALLLFTQEYLLVLGDSAKALEQECIEQIVISWLEIEQTRGEFSVQAREHRQKLHIGPLELDGTIDRIDELGDGSTLLIDYKTGRTAKAKWLPDPRIKDPQLPAYALTMDPQPNAIAFARLKPDDMRFDGLADGDAETSGITSLEKTGYGFKDLNEWTELLDGWQDNLQHLAAEFKAGQAAVDPRDAQACKYCHLKALCRVHERDPNLADSFAESTEPNDDE